jgi:hypothetical protein
MRPEIGLSQALGGFTMQIQHLDGTRVRCVGSVGGCASGQFKLGRSAVQFVGTSVSDHKNR